jgi:hypothetical protein
MRGRSIGAALVAGLAMTVAGSLSAQQIETPPAARSIGAARPSQPASPRIVVNCSGPFAKDSSMLSLATVFGSKNVTYTETEVAGSKVGTTIIFPKDPKRRLEVWWSNLTNRSGTYLILINGQSTWTAPGGMRLSMTLAQLEKLNGKRSSSKALTKTTSRQSATGTAASLPRSLAAVSRG